MLPIARLTNKFLSLSPHTESDIDDAMRQKRIMTATLTNKFGVIESFERSISQAGVDDTNLEGGKI